MSSVCVYDLKEFPGRLRPKARSFKGLSAPARARVPRGREPRFGDGTELPPHSARSLSSGEFNGPGRLWRLGVQFAYEMEFVRDQAQHFIPVVVESGEEPVHRRLEIGEGGKVLIVDRGFLE